MQKILHSKSGKVTAGAIILAIILIATIYGVIDWNVPGGFIGPTKEPTIVYTAPDGKTFTNYNEYVGYMQQKYPGVSPEEQTTTPTTQIRDASAIQLEVIDAVKSAGVTTATTTADIVLAVGGIFDFVTQADTKTVSANPQAMNTIFSQGAEVILHVDCTGDPTGGLDYYDGWYYTKLLEGTPVYYLKPSMLQQVAGSPHYTYRVNTAGAITTGYQVSFTSGTTNYWNVGKLPMWPRSSAANFDMYLSYQGVDLASVTDGSTWVDDDSDITANATLASDTESLVVSVYMGAADVGWAKQQLVVSSEGEMQVYEAVIIMSTAMTAIGTTSLQQKGWNAISDNTLYTEKAFYKVIGEQFTTKGSKHSFSVEVPIDATAAAASTAFLFKFWLIDMQLPENVGIGSVTTTVPTAYGCVTAYGVGAMIQASAYSTSSGASSGEVLQSYITTAA